MRKNKKPLFVMKFGGTSVGDAERIDAVAQILMEHSREADVVAVVSAMAGVTDALIRSARTASIEDGDKWRPESQSLVKRHQQAGEKLLPAGERARFMSTLSQQMMVYENLCSGFSLLREITPRAMDTLSSLGEVLTATLLAAVLRSKGAAAEAVDAMDLIVTDERFGNATPLSAETRENTSKHLLPMLEAGTIPVVTGFRAATREGICTTLGRGGSDYSGTILGAALDAEEIWIWTDVDGVMTADPRLVPGAHMISEISYLETLELSFFGAKVLHPRAIQPAMKAGIPVLIRNTFNTACEGTKVSGRATSQNGVRAITGIAKAALVAVSGKDGLSFPRLAARVFGALSVEDVSTLMVTQSSADNVLCFAIHEADQARVCAKLEKTFELEMRHDSLVAIDATPHVGMVVAVGEKMRGIHGLAGRMFGALGRRAINIIAIAQGSSEISISIAVKSDEVSDALKAIHEEFEL